jgi:hypothetical protein
MYDANTIIGAARLYGTTTRGGYLHKYKGEISDGAWITQSYWGYHIGIEVYVKTTDVSKYKKERKQ